VNLPPMQKKAYEAVNAYRAKHPGATLEESLKATKNNATNYYKALARLKPKRLTKAKSPTVIDVTPQAASKAVIIVCDTGDIKNTLSNIFGS
jgi:hypothetical protein